VLDDARLVASELVNNTVLYSGCAPDDIMRVMAALDDGFLVISVDVPVTAVPEVRQPAEDVEPGGLGLRVVQHLAHRWGAQHPRVWAALAVDN
jgi:anti-sigma regulatory factor (Ser/Thr protein kinase)